MWHLHICHDFLWGGQSLTIHPVGALACSAMAGAEEKHLCFCLGFFLCL